MVERVVSNSVDQRGFTGARLQPANFGEGRAIARGAEELGQGLRSAANDLQAIGQAQDEAVVKTADTEDLKAIMDIRAEVLNSTGLEAPAKVAEANKKIEEIKRNRMATFSNHRQRTMYQDVFDARDLQMQQQFADHSVKQLKEAERVSAITRGETYADLAVDTYGTDGFEANVQTTLGEVAAANRGMPAEVIERKQAVVQSKIYSRVIDGMLANPDSLHEAQLAIESNADKLLPDDEHDLRKKLNPLIEEDQTTTDAGWAFSGAPIPGEERDPLVPADEQPEEHYYQPKETDHPAEAVPSKNWLPVAGGKVTNNAQQHRVRGSGNALDVAAPEGTPIHAPMSGKVIKSWWDEKGGWSVLVEHPNGYVTGYAHMRSKSPLDVGAHVENTTVLGSVGQTGHATGPHVHYTVRQSKGGPKVDPEMAWSGAVKPSSVSWKEDKLVKYDAEENTLGVALERLHKRASAKNWSNHRYQNAVNEARRIAGVQDQLYNQGQEMQWKSALDTVANLGDKLTSRTQIPNYSKLDGGHRIAIDNIIKGNKTKSDESKAGGANYFRYFDMAMNPATRADFTKVDLLKDPTLSTGERKQLYNMQWDIANDENGTLTGKMDEASTFANRYLPKQDFPDPEVRQHFQDVYMQRVTVAQQKNGRPLTDREKDDIARGLVTPIVLYQTTPKGEQKVGKKLFMDYQGPEKGQRAEVNFEEVYRQIPQPTHDRIRTELARQGKSHSKQDIVRVYLEQAR